MVTVLGSAPSVSAGEWITAKGRWVQDKEHGLQFKAQLLKATPPTTNEGVKRYLRRFSNSCGVFGSCNVAFTSTPATRICRRGPRVGKRHFTASAPLYTNWRTAIAAQSPSRRLSFQPNAFSKCVNSRFSPGTKYTLITSKRACGVYLAGQLAHVLAGQAAQNVALVGIDGLFGRRYIPRGAGLDLEEAEHRPLPGDEVQIAGQIACRPSPRYHRVALAAQVRANGFLALDAGRANGRARPAPPAARSNPVQAGQRPLKVSSAYLSRLLHRQPLSARMRDRRKSLPAAEASRPQITQISAGARSQIETPDSIPELIGNL